MERVAEKSAGGCTPTALRDNRSMENQHSSGKVTNAQIRDQFNIDVSDVYAAAIGEGLGGVETPAFGVDAGTAPTLAYVDACYEEVLLDTTVEDPDGITAGALAKLTPAQADELADALRRAAADVREYKGGGE